MKQTDNKTSLHLRQAIGDAMKKILLVAAGLACVVFTVAVGSWLTDHAIKGLEYVWGLRSWAVSMTTCGMVWCLVVISEFIRLTLNGTGLMRKNTYDIWIGLYFGIVVILLWALCAVLFWMLFHLQGGEGDIQVPLMVVSLFVSMLYPLILSRLIRDS